MSDAPKIPTPEEQLKILKGGRTVKVKFTDERPDEVVKVREIHIKDMEELGMAMGQEISEVMVYVSKPREWVEALTSQSFKLLVTEGQDINFTEWSDWYNRKLRMLKALGQSDAIAKAIQSATEKATENLGRPVGK